MSDISAIDKNFHVGSTISKEGIKFYDVKCAPFSIHGLMNSSGIFHRIPIDVAENTNDGVKHLNYNTAGGRVRFKTDSPYVAISAKYSSLGRMPHFAFCGSIGFDLYEGTRYVKTFTPTVDPHTELESIINLGEPRMRDIVINFPLYSSVTDLYIGLAENAKIKKPEKYSNQKPIVYYGSSITQGGCASRPGTCYQAYISRRFNADYVNLGFSGSARAEDAIIDYIKGLDMGLFVYDYDYNAPTLEHLRATHEKMFLAVREANPTLPIIMMSRPLHKCNRTNDDEQRMKIVKRTYENAKARGDRNVYFLSGDDLTELCGNEGTVDNCHPTDFGFASMADALIRLIKAENLL
jgi:hypothetical protein